MGFWDSAMSFGKKIGGLVNKGMRFGQKVASAVGGIASKVMGVSKYVKPFLPQTYRGGLSKVVDVAKTAKAGATQVSGGIQRAKELQSKAQKVTDVSSGVKLAKEAYYTGKNAVNSTRSTLARPNKKDNVSSSVVVTPATKPVDRATQRAMPNKGIKDNEIGRGLQRSHGANGEVQKAIAMAKSAQNMLRKTPKRGGILRRK